MVFCKNRAHGCPRSFSTRYGMKVHLRSCACEIPNNEMPETSNKGRSCRTPTSHQVSFYQQEISYEEVRSSDCDESVGYNTMQDCDNLKSALTAADDSFPNVSTFFESGERNVNSLLKLRLGRIGRKCSQKDVDGVISLLAHRSFELNKFVSTCSGYKECMIEEESIIQRSLGTVGFKKHRVTDHTTEVSCDLYLRSTVDVLQSQVAGASDVSCFFNPKSNQDNVGNPMTAELGKAGVHAISSAIMSSSDKGVLWHDSITSLESSFVGLIQVYSDKSKTSLKESGFQFYPLHVTLLNFSEEYKRDCIVSGATFLAFLPVLFYRDVDGHIMEENVDRPQKLRLLHLAMDIVLTDICNLGYCGFSCKDSEGRRRRCHPCVVSYCCDLPESKDMSSVKNGNSSERNCHRCLAQTNHFNVLTASNHRTGNETERIIREARNLRREGKKDCAEKLMDKYSLVDQLPSLLKLPFLRIHPCLDMHLLFTFEPLHCFHLGISKELKKCMADRLRSESLTTSNIPNRSGIYKERTFRNSRMTILNGVNRMLSHVQRSSPAKGFRVDFSASCKGESGNGLYGDDGKLIGMLEAKDYKSVDMIFPFIGMFSDRCCGESSIAPCTNLFVEYVDLMQMTMSYRGTKQWTRSKIETLEKMIEQFKNHATDLFGDHQRSRFRTEKFHALDHICQDIRRMGSIVSGDAGLYEHAHTLVKTAYRSGSKRRQSVMDETILSLLKEMNNSSLNKIFDVEGRNISPQPCKTISNINFAQDEARRTDCAVLVRKGTAFSLEELQRCRSLARRVRKAKEEGNQDTMESTTKDLNRMKSFLHSIVDDVTEDGCRILISQLRLLQQYDSSSAEKYRITRVMSGYVPGLETPVGKDYDPKLGMINVKRSEIRYAQRMVSGRGFYGSTTLRQDCVLIQGNDSSSSRVHLWVGKILMMLRTSNIHKEPQTEDERNKLEEYVFVQYFEIQELEDEIDSALDCVRLRWARDEAEDDSRKRKGNLDPVRKWFDLLPVSSIRGVVHVVRGDYGIEGRCATRGIDEVPWYNQSFYINRFYFNSDNLRYNNIE